MHICTQQRGGDSPEHQTHCMPLIWREIVNTIHNAHAFCKLCVIAQTQYDAYIAIDTLTFLQGVNPSWCTHALAGAVSHHSWKTLDCSTYVFIPVSSVGDWVNKCYFWKLELKPSPTRVMMNRFVTTGIIWTHGKQTHFKLYHDQITLKTVFQVYTLYDFQLTPCTTQRKITVTKHHWWHTECLKAQHISHKECAIQCVPLWLSSLCWALSPW